jgi:glycosyltransferase involved in cell wall biosynthesis
MDTLGANIRSIVTEARRETRGALSSAPAKPRVLVVNVFYPPQSIGGATRLVQDNVEAFRRDHADSFEVEVFCSTDSGATPGEVHRYNWNGTPVTALTPYPVKDFAIADASPKTAAAFRTLLTDLRPDLIHFHAVQRLTASLLDEAAAAGVPYLVTAHDGWWISDHQFLLDNDGRPVTESGRWGDPARLQRLKARLAGAVHVLAVSKTFGDLYRSRGLINVLDVPNGVTRLPEPPMPEGDKVVLGLLGGLGAAKGADLLHTVLTLSSYENLRFVVVDHGAPEGSARTEFWGRNPVEIIGKVPQAKVASLYARLHGVLAPSVCIESFGLVTREALSLGRWVAASDRGAIGEDVVEGVNGFVIDVSDPVGLLEALRVMDADPDRFRRSPPPGPPPRTSREQADELAAIYRRVLSAN